MKLIGKLQDLEQFGLICLTGEACALMLRILFDVTARGRKIVCQSFGLPATTKLADAWNRGRDGAPHVGSIMLNANELRTISVFALLDAGCREVYAIEPRISPQQLADRQRRLIDAYKELNNPESDDAEHLVRLRASVDGMLTEIEGLGRQRNWFEGCVYGAESTDSDDHWQQMFELWQRDGWSWRRFSYDVPGSDGTDRNVHQMSGRTN